VTDALAVDTGMTDAAGRRGWLRLSSTMLAFLLAVVAPTMLTAGYLYGVASDRYVTEAQFIVRGVSGRHVGGLAAVFRTFGIARAEDDAFAVHGYMVSRDAMTELDKRLDIRAMFSRPDIDILSRFPQPWRSSSTESLQDFYESRVSVVYKASQGISTLTVTAWRPEDANAIAETLLKLGEELINRMNQRANNDSLSNAERERQAAEKLVVDSQVRITEFRNREMLIDPSLSSLNTMELIGRLSVELAQARAQLAETSMASPGSPALRPVQTRIQALQDQITAERSKVVGTDDALAQKVTEYERLALSRAFADRNLESTQNALETARQEARRQQIYIETVVRPRAADESTEPRRLRWAASVFVLGFALFSMVWLVISGSREHSHG
jgi:capsular polysaccharide transport system permease protein